MTALNGIRIHAYYINTRRLNDLVGRRIPVEAQTSLALNSEKRVAAMDIAQDVAEFVIRSGKIPPVYDVLDVLEIGQSASCCIYGLFSFKGVRQVSAGMQRPLKARLAGKISIDDQVIKFDGALQAEHLVSWSSTVALSGTKKTTVCGAITRVEGDNFELSPYIIYDLALSISGFNLNARQYIRVFPDEIEQFSYSAKKKVAQSDLELLNSMSESEVKNAFAEIINEPFVRKDWPGERSDLVTNHLIVSKKTLAAAFIFKGPGLRRPLYVANMGLRGDQMLRAFKEPVELVVIQHCNRIESAVVEMAEALAGSASTPKRFCILDGSDTCRVLIEHGKLVSGKNAG